MTTTPNPPSLPPRSIEDRNALLVAHQPLLTVFVKRLMATNPAIARLGYDDAFGAGQFGLLSATEDWDPARGKFSTHAWPRVRAAVQQAARDAWAITLPLRAARGDSPHPFAVISLAGDHLARKADATLPEPEALEVADAVDRLERTHRRLALILRLHSDGLTNEAIGKQLGVTRERIRQLLPRAIDRVLRILSGGRPQQTLSAKRGRKTGRAG